MLKHPGKNNNEHACLTVVAGFNGESNAFLLYCSEALTIVLNKRFWEVYRHVLLKVSKKSGCSVKHIMLSLVVVLTPPEIL